MNGFLGTRGSFMLDVVVLAMVLVTGVLLASIAIVRFHRNHRLHRRIQLTLAAVLVVALMAFEIDMQLVTDWRALARPSPWFGSGNVYKALWVHLAFAIPTPFVWAAAIFFALRHYRPGTEAGGSGFANEKHAARHRVAGRIAVALMLLTAVTGWIFYWMAFVA